MISAIRSIWRSKRFALTALLTFSFGIGATATVFSVLDAVLLHPATFPDASSVISIEYSEKHGDWDAVPASAFHQIALRHDLFSESAAARLELFTVTRVPRPDQVFGLSVSGEYFRMLDAKPLIGRVLLPEDDRPQSAPAVLLSFRGWQQLFHSDPHVLGKTAELDGTLYTVIGVMPMNFVPPDSNTAGLLWTTLRLTPASFHSADERHLRVYARLRKGVTPGAAQSFLESVAARIEASAAPGRKPIQLRAQPWHNEPEPAQRYTLWLALGMAAGLLLIGCSNLSSLLLARGIRRNREYAIRLAIGATRGELIRQSLLEIGMIALAAFVVACFAASGALHLIRTQLAAMPTGMPNLARIELNTDSLLFGFGVTLISALLCAFFPALSATSIDLVTGLRDTSTNISGGRSVQRFLHTTVAVQAAISILLLLNSGLLVRSLIRLLSEDHGFRADHVLTLRLPTGSWDAKALSPENIPRRIQHYLNLLQRARATSGVEAAALSSSLPLSHTVVRTRVAIPGQPAIMPICQSVTGDYFRAMAIPLLAGRSFDARDTAPKLKRAIINEAFAQKYFAGEDPIGGFLLDEPDKSRIEIIGVAKNAPHLDYAEKVEPQIYLEFQQHLMTPFLTGLVVRTIDSPQQVAKRLRSTLALSAADQPVVRVLTLKNLIQENTWMPRFSAWLFSGFAALALCLAGMGMYGVVAYVTAARRREYGIRLSLGAHPAGLFQLATLQNLRPVLIGIGCGAAGSYWTAKWIASLLYNTSAFDPFTLTVTFAILLLIALAATAGPAFRAARTDPAITLRHE